VNIIPVSAAMQSFFIICEHLNIRLDGKTRPIFLDLKFTVFRGCLPRKIFIAPKIFEYLSASRRVRCNVRPEGRDARAAVCPIGPLVQRPISLLAGAQGAPMSR
jgi:hypothetical protein